MINKLFKVFFIFIFILLQGCGFKVQDQSSFKNFHIEEINASGDNRINFNIKNKLFLKTGAKDRKHINLIIDTIKTKNIKEKNEQNIITKHIIKIDIKIIVKINDKIVRKFNLSDEKDFNVTNQYSQTIKNEKQAIKDITDRLIDKIIREISNIELNDT